MREPTDGSPDGLAPEQIAALFRHLGLSAEERQVALPPGPRWAVLLRGGDTDLWVEAADRAAAWHKSLAHARAVGRLK